MTVAIVQKAGIGNVSGSPDTLTATFPSPPTQGNEIIAISCLNLPTGTPTWPFGYTPLTVIDQATDLPWLLPGIHAAVKTVGPGESSSVTVTRPGGDRSTLHIFEVPPGSFNGGIVITGASGPPIPLVDVTTTDPESLLIAISAYLNATFVATPPSGWTLEQEPFGISGSNSLESPSFSRVVGPGTWGGSFTLIGGSGNPSPPVVTFTFIPAPVPPPEPGPIVDVYDGDDVFLATLPAKDVQIRVELNGVGSGSFKVRRDAAEATAAILAPGNYVRVTIPQIDPDPIVGFFLDDGDFVLVSSSEKGGEMIGFSGHGALSYWSRAIWLAESFLVDWVPAFIRTGHGAPPAGTLGAIHYAAGSYRRFTIGGGAITSRIDFSTGGFSSYYDQRVRVNDGSGNKVTLIHLTTGGVSGWWVRPYGAGVTDYKKVAHYVYGNSVLMESIDDGDKPGAVLASMYNEAFAADRPINPIPRMTIDFDGALDSDGNAWTTTDALRGVAAALNDDYLSTVGKLVETGVLDVEMGPDLDMHAYNARGRDLTGAAFGTGVVRFVKGVNIAGELRREFSDPPIGTFAQVLGPNDGDVGLATLPSAGPPREIGIRGETSDTAALEALGEAELGRRLLHSDSVAFGVGVPMVGREDDDAGLYVPGPPWSAHGRYWTGDYVTLWTGSDEHDFDDVDVRVAAVVMWFTEANGLKASVEVGSSLGGLEILGYPSSSGGGYTSSGGTGSSGSIPTTELYQLVSERDKPNGYPTLDDDGLISPLEIPLIEALRALETDTALVLAPDGAGGVEFRAETGGISTADDILALGFVGPILLADGHATPFTFNDLLQLDDGSGFMHADL